MRLSKAQLKALKEIKSRSKGLPVGIPINKLTALALYKRKLVEWAPPLWRYSKPVYACRLTTEGELELKIFA